MKANKTIKTSVFPRFFRQCRSYNGWLSTCPGACHRNYPNPHFGGGLVGVQTRGVVDVVTVGCIFYTIESLIFLPFYRLVFTFYNNEASSVGHNTTQQSDTFSIIHDNIPHGTLKWLMMKQKKSKKIVNLYYYETSKVCHCRHDIWRGTI